MHPMAHTLLIKFCFCVTFSSSHLPSGKRGISRNYSGIPPIFMLKKEEVLTSLQQREADPKNEKFGSNVLMA
jgi:hypothetical protein